jgi:hypothetical protein
MGISAGNVTFADLEQLHMHPLPQTLWAQLCSWALGCSWTEGMLSLVGCF